MKTGQSSKIFAVSAVMLLMPTMCNSEQINMTWMSLLLNESASISEPTPNPTPTPEPEPEPEPDPEPEPIPEPEPGPEVQISNNHSYFIDIIDNIHIVGEIVNNTSHHIKYTKISVHLFDEAGELLDTDYTYTPLDSISPGEKACFAIWVDQPQGWSTYAFEDVDYSTGADPRPPLSLTNHKGEITEGYSGSEYEVLGLVQNNQDKPVKYVDAISTLYNAQGVVVDCDYSYTNSTDLKPGESSAFKISFSLRSNYDDVTSHSTLTGGRWE